jgi:hypothetical protein
MNLRAETEETPKTKSNLRALAQNALERDGTKENRNQADHQEQQPAFTRVYVMGTT